MMRVFKYIFICLIIMIICVFTSDSFNCFVTLAASAASITGVIISLHEIVGMKTKTEAVNESIKDARDSISRFLTYSEINSLSGLIDEIEAYLHSDGHESALIKMKELKDMMCSISGYNKNSQEDSEQSFEVIIQKIGMDVHSLHCSISEKTSLNKSVMYNNLEKAKELLNKLSGEIKSSEV